MTATSTRAAADEPGEPWRDRAVARSLDGARSRAEERVQRFLDATVALINENGGLEFTVQNVVERSGQSLRSFYQVFYGKQHLLLAVYEESMHESAIRLEEIVDEIEDPLARVETFVTTLYEWSEREPIELPPAPHQTVRAMANFVFSLLTTDSEQATLASRHLFDLLVRLLDDANTADLLDVANTRQAAALVLQTTMFNAFGTVTTGAPTAHHDRAQEMWNFCLGGLTGRQASASPTP